MSANQKASPRQTKWLGALCAGMGAYFMLAGFGIVPAGKSNPNDSLWIGVVAGLIFFLGGLAVMMQDIAGANEQGELPAAAPRWMRVAQALIGVVLFASFALIGTYVALRGDERGFSGGIPFIGHAANVSIARVVFGIGALICWLAAAFAAMRLRKTFSRD